MSPVPPPQLQLSRQQLKEAVAAVWWMFSAACSKTPPLSTRPICLTWTVKYVQVIKKNYLKLLCQLSALFIELYLSLKSCFLGQKPEDEPAAKKARLTKKPDTKPPRLESASSRPGDVSPVSQTQATTAYPHQDAATYQHLVPPSSQANMEPSVPESQPQPYQEDPSIMAPPAQTPVLIPLAVSSVSITRRDPRMARHTPGVNIVQTPPEKPNISPAEPVLPAALTAPVDIGAKVPLPMPPAAPSPVAVAKSSTKRFSSFSTNTVSATIFLINNQCINKMHVRLAYFVKTFWTHLKETFFWFYSTSEPLLEGETAIFLHGQETIWKGFVNMHTVAKFATKAYLVSGSFEHLKEVVYQSF